MGQDMWRQISTGLPGGPGVMASSKMGILEMKPILVGHGEGYQWPCQIGEGRMWWELLAHG